LRLFANLRLIVDDTYANPSPGICVSFAVLSLGLESSSVALGPPGIGLFLKFFPAQIVYSIDLD
jgi:hypothetical protein